MRGEHDLVNSKANQTFLLSFHSQTSTLLHAGQAPHIITVRPSRADLEDAHLHLCAGLRSGDALGSQVIDDLAGFPLLPHHDGADQTANGATIHPTRAQGGKFFRKLSFPA